MHGIDVQVANVDHYYGACMQLGECPTLAIYSYRPLTYVILSINLAYKPLQSSAIYIYIYIYIYIRLGATLCVPHDCPRCGMQVDHSGVHGLSCRSSQGRVPQHTALNDIVHRALSAANVPSTLEPCGLRTILVGW